ncbi:MAG: ABC transporter permease [Gemmatimonadales bacterium]
MSAFLQDLRFTVRSLRRRRLFAAVAIVTMALGIGATTAIYSVVDGVLLRPLPFHDTGRLVQIRLIFYSWKGNPVFGTMWDRVAVGMDEYEKLRDKSTSYSSLGAWSGAGVVLSDPVAGREELRGIRASASLLGVLGERVVRGRDFTPGEDQVGGPHVALIGYEYWQRKYGGRDDAIGSFLKTEDAGDLEIVGVLPRGLTLEQRGSIVDVWTLAGQDPGDRNHGNRSYSMIGRLRPGVSLARANGEAAQLLATKNEQTRIGARVQDWHVEQTRDVRAPLFLLLAAVGLLLMIACVNVAMLLLGEAAARGQEMAARIALGAGRGRLVRQLLTESVALSGIGAVCGTVLAWGTVKGLVASAPPQIPGMPAVHIDVRVLLFAAGAAVATGILFGLAPALSLSRLSAGTILRSDARQIVAGRGVFQRSLVTVELAFSFLLLVGAALFSRSLDRLTAVNPGFRTDSLLAISLSLPPDIAHDSVRTREFYRTLLVRVAAMPGVAAVTAGSTTPFMGGSSSSPNEIEGHPLPAGTRGADAQNRVVIPGYFVAMGIPLMAGRSLGEEDQSGSEPVVVISQAMAARDFPGENALGRHIKHQGTWRTVVGIVGDVKLRDLASENEATIYVPNTQRTFSALQLLVRTRVPTATLAAPIKAAILELAPSAIVRRTEVMSELVKKSFASERFRTMLVTLFGVLAVIIASVGLYGVTARTVGHRKREVAIRVALGASGRSVVALLVRATLSGVVAGIAAGVLAGAVVARWAAPLLYGIDARDPATYGAIALLLVGISLTASWLPARKAARVQPAIVLRGE